MLACSKLLREHHSSMLDAMVLDHERATGQWHVEWHAIPNAFLLLLHLSTQLNIF